MSESGSYIGFHMQDPFEQWDQMYNHAYLAGRRFRLLKSFHPEDQARLHAVSPGTAFIYRHHIQQSHQGEFIERAIVSPAEADRAADDYIRQFSDSVNQHMNGGYAESLNEEYPTRNPEKLAKIVAFDRAFVRRLPVICPGVKPVVFTAAIGNPDHHEYGALVDLARETAAAGGAFGYHPYWTVYNRQSFVNNTAVARDLHMRWDVIDEYLVARGIRVKWMLGETGATKGNASGYNPDVLAGWKHHECWGGDEDAYLADIAAFDELIAGTRAAREGRLIGATLFTSRPGDGGTWRYFNVTGSMAWRVANYVASKAPPPDPEPEPEPIPMLEKELWNTGLQRQVISINARAALGNRIYADDMVPMSPEYDVRLNGDIYRAQRAGALTSSARRVYYCKVPQWDTVWYIDAPEPLFASPVGTVEERQSGVIWPGDWINANPFGNRYRLGDGWSIHTGADLNLNKPTWDADKGMPVHATGHGIVTYARRVPTGTWGRLVVIQHEIDGGMVWSRYGHMASMLVEEGQVVRRGDVIGTIGGVEFGLPNHLHFDISPSGILASNPTHWPGDNLPAVRAHYVDPELWLQSRR